MSAQETKVVEAGPEREQRRSPRYAAALTVQLAFGTERQVVRTLDVSQHGLFVATDRPPRERFMVQLTIYLPDGVLPAAAFVSRSVRRGGPHPAGVGLHLFALEAGSKTRWDRFVRSLGGEATPPPTLDSGRLPRDESRPTFLLKLRDEARLEELYEKNLVSGELYLATPVIKEPGTEVVLIVIHPRTEHELPLIGRVVQVHRERPKGMAIRLHPPLDEADLAVCREFVRTGQAPRAEAKATVSTDDVASTRTTLDIVIEPPVLYHPDQPDFEWSQVSDGLIVDLDLDDDDPFAGRTPTPAAFAEGSWIEAGAEPVVEPIIDEPLDLGAPEEFTEGVETISIDLDAPDSMPHPVAEPPLPPEPPAPVDADAPVGAAGATGPEVTTADLTGDAVEGPTSDLEQPVDPWAPEEIAPHPHAAHEPELHVRLTCSACDAPPVTLDLGGLAGPLGYLARRRAYLCGRCETFVSISRLKPVAERRKVKESLWLARADALSAKVDLELLFEVAAMASNSARCPICGAAGRTNDATAAIEDALLTLEPGVLMHVEHAPCQRCGEPLRIELL